jgi:hypothetical protein
LNGVDNNCSDEVEQAVNKLYLKMYEAEKDLEEIDRKFK